MKKSLIILILFVVSGCNSTQFAILAGAGALAYVGYKTCPDVSDPPQSDEEQVAKIVDQRP